MKELRTFGVFQEGRSHYTKALVPGQVYDEDIIREGKNTYREWNPYKSKWGAYLAKGAPDIFLRENNTVLYLGVASGTTASHVSDIIHQGMVFGVDIAFRPMMDFVFLSEKRKNLAPFLADASQVDTFASMIPKEVDVVFQDIAQRDQVGIFMKNVDKFLKKKGFGLLAVKARSVDVTKNPKEVFREIRKKLEEKYTIVDVKSLEPFEKDHCMMVIKK